MVSITALTSRRNLYLLTFFINKMLPSTPSQYISRFLSANYLTAPSYRLQSQFGLTWRFLALWPTLQPNNWFRHDIMTVETLLLVRTSTRSPLKRRFPSFITLNPPKFYFIINDFASNGSAPNQLFLINTIYCFLTIFDILYACLMWS